MISTSPSTRAAPVRVRVRAVLSAMGGAFLIALAGCDSSPSGPQVASVSVETPSPQVVVGESVQLTAVALDASGNPIPGQTATWSSTVREILTVDANGRATGVSLGSARARAEIAGVVGSQLLQVVPPPVTDIIVAPTEVTVPRGGEVQLTVTLLGADGNELNGRSITFQSANPTIALVSTAGLVQGMQVGTTQVTVSSGDVSIVVPVTVVASDAPTIESISPAVLGEGMEIEIIGERFSSSPSLNTVRIGGALATVLEASPTRLLVRTPTLICVPSGMIQVIVQVAGEVSPPAQVPFAAEPGLSLAPGEFQLLTGAAAGCLRLGATTSSSSFLVGVQSTTGNPDAVTPISVTGTPGQPPSSASTGDPAGAALDHRDGAARAPAAGPRPTSFSAVAEAHLVAAHAASDELARHHAAEAQLRSREQEIMGPSLAEGAAFLDRQRTLMAQGAAGATATATVPASVRLGDTLTVNIPDIRPGQNFCQTGIPVQVVVRRVGSGSIWIEDVLNPQPGLSAGDYSALGSQFDDVTVPRLRTHFGEPTDIDGNDRIVVVISQQVNRFGNILGFVVSSDFYPTTICPASNVGEFYYTVTPDPTGQIPAPSPDDQVRLDVDGFRSVTPVLAAHEATHIIQFGRRIQAGASILGTIWELEGQAVLAEEVVGMDMLGLGPRQNLGLSVAFPPSGTVPVIWFRNAFADLAAYYGFLSPTTRASGAPEACSWLGRREVSGPCNTGRLPYGVSWSFLRWLSDHYGNQFAGGEAEMHRRLVEINLAGFPAIEQVVGESRGPLLAYWAASLYTDGRLPSGADPRLSFPSWDLRGIEAGLFETARLQPANVSFSGFSANRSVAAGSSYYMRLDGPAQPSFAMRTTTQAGSPLPGHMQVWVVRLQ
ncbi:hypothetical protein BH23GEM11_BH23GEM11_16110 [soil metagenome]